MKSFWRPFLIFFVAFLLLLLLSPLLPGCDSKVFPLKKLDLYSKIKDTFSPSIKDSVSTPAKDLHISSQMEPLNSFRDKLQSLKSTGNSSVRIAYFGDSIIEGDLITGKLREQLQTQYGGSGVGLVPITSIVNEFRRTIRHTFSKNWETMSFMNRGNGADLGMIGYSFIPRNYYIAESLIEKEPTPSITDSLGNVIEQDAPAESKPQKQSKRFYVSGPSWVEYSGVKYAGGSQTFKRIRLFYSHATSQSSILVSYEGGSKSKIELSPGDNVQVLDLSQASPISKIRLEFNPLDPIHVYGVSFDDQTGAYVDNLSVRGFSGMYFNALTEDNLRAFHNSLGYDLIVLQYGENVSSPKISDYSFYRKGMTKTIKHLQSAMPGVPILVLSAHDRSIKQNGVYQTSPDIPLLVQTQGQIALDTGSGFWNVYDAMGGLNSMLAYVKTSPPLANLDYTHFTISGANKISLMLYNVLTTGKNR
jgi:hypothetical protein